MGNQKIQLLCKGYTREWSQTMVCFVAVGDTTDDANGGRDTNELCEVCG